MFSQSLIKRSLVLGLTTAAAAFPAAAQAMHIEDSGGLPSAASVPVTGPQPASRFATPPTVQNGDSSFQWGDAGIGAAGAVVLVAAGAAGSTVTRRRRRPVLS